MTSLQVCGVWAVAVAVVVIAWRNALRRPRMPRETAGATIAWCFFLTAIGLILGCLALFGFNGPQWLYAIVFVAANGIVLCGVEELPGTVRPSATVGHATSKGRP